MLRIINYISYIFDPVKFSTPFSAQSKKQTLFSGSVNAYLHNRFQRPTKMAALLNCKISLHTFQVNFILLIFPNESVVTGLFIRNFHGMDQKAGLV